MSPGSKPRPSRPFARPESAAAAEAYSHSLYKAGKPKAATITSYIRELRELVADLLIDAE